ncbi:hypothetical protein F4821DRAFT_250002 [Hypoxylon rubiginosum]|uniref:Uncharacterized protein n=1 Tax=Hypoxylon rubiginosum TaxID=110542 RepID=A0ACC0CL31_9PEZI|nr:hypothetical protein F4821DRAFT_250002 [Hypoxylon rubiginosum]
MAYLVKSSWKSFGVPELPNNDSNAGSKIGFGEFTENRKQGARQIAPSVYCLYRVSVLTNTLVGSILIDEDNDARGVRLADGREIYSNEVIISAGAYRTPQLLMLSGLGPKEVLDKHGIEVKVDIPGVGQNLNDHIMLHLNWKLKALSVRNLYWGDVLGSSNPIFAEPRFATGTPSSYVAYTKMPPSDLEAAIAKDEGKVDSDHYLLKREWAVMENIVMYVATPPVRTDGRHISTVQMALKPTSRGTVTIASNDPADDPVIDPNYFATEVDKSVWRHSLRNIESFMTRDAFLGPEIDCETPPPGFEPLTEEASDEYLDSRVKAHGV